MALDFVNTVGNRLDPARRRDHLRDFADLVAWSRQAGALADADADALVALAAARGPESERALGRARTLRESLSGVVAATALGRPAPAEDLATINGFVGDLLAASRLEPTADGFVLTRQADPAALDRVLWPIVRSAIGLLTSAELRNVGQCADNACGWVFVDGSRGRRRRWCDMADCGNQAKARRHRARQSAARS